jgi:hypothetical protein
MLQERHHDLISMVEDPGILRCFSLEATVESIHTQNDMWGSVTVFDLQDRVATYDGNIYLRPARVTISLDQSRQFILNHLGRSFETNLLELAKSTFETQNQARIEKLYCSEAAVVFYQETGVLDPTINPSNIIPLELSSYAGPRDVLKDIVGPEAALKNPYDFGSRWNRSCTLL